MCEAWINNLCGLVYYLFLLHRKNVCKLQVFYEDLNIDVIAEQRSYEV